ncbi:hypothetical protein [Acidocella sp.]|uniref:hypothetical protein n=1 Tax=Acidocella sp. TaxID=50710 RepID=UPI002F40D231
MDATGLGFWNARQYAVGPTISLPLFEGGQLRGQLRLRRAQQKQAVIDYRRTSAVRTRCRRLPQRAERRRPTRMSRSRRSTPRSAADGRTYFRHRIERSGHPI